MTKMTMMKKKAVLLRVVGRRWVRRGGPPEAWWSWSMEKKEKEKRRRRRQSRGVERAGWVVALARPAMDFWSPPQCFRPQSSHEQSPHFHSRHLSDRNLEFKMQRSIVDEEEEGRTKQITTINTQIIKIIKALIRNKSIGTLWVVWVCR
jgi:hypothetical protein